MLLKVRWLVCLALATAAVLALGTEARAQFYVGGEAGWTALEDQSGTVSGAPVAVPRVNQSWDSGFAVGARAGYEMGPWRFEGEYAYRRNDLSGVSVGGTKIGGASGSREAHALMVNALYDINLGWPVTPHIGAGIGAVNLVENVRVPGIGQAISDDDWQFGYQAIAGLRYNITPALALDLDYRYLGTTEPSFRTVPAPGIRIKSGYDSHNLMASLVYRFGTPPPPPPPVVAAPAVPAPPPTARRVFLVFFDWDRATITPDGQAIVQQAADAYKSGARVQIQVTGYTDRSGSVAYNQRLSERRANVVAAALARLGVARHDMAVSGRGENDNRVPTAKGVREPQNRRVEIVFP